MLYEKITNHSGSKNEKKVKQNWDENKNEGVYEMNHYKIEA